MEYLKLQWGFITSQEWRRSSMAARGASASLLGYCFRVENAGLIVGAERWSKKDWQAAADCTRRDVDVAVAAGLAYWEGVNLVVRGYDHRGHARLSVQRDQAPHGTKGAEHGKKGGRPPKEKPPTGTPLDNPPRGFPENPPNPDQTIPDQPNPPAAAPPSTPPAAAAAADDFLTRPDPAATNAPRLTLGDLEAANPVLVVFRTDRDRAETMLALYGWEGCQSALNVLGVAALKRPPGRQRVTVSELAAWLAVEWVLDAEDYRRAGLPVPATGP